VKKLAKTVLNVEVSKHAEVIQRYSKNINDNTFDFVIMYKSDRGGFTHYCKLYKDFDLVSSGKARYLNRTWEAYTGQSVMRNTLNRAAEHQVLSEEEIKELKAFIEAR
jgi:hypothetical protein